MMRRWINKQPGIPPPPQKKKRKKKKKEIYAVTINVSMIEFSNFYNITVSGGNEYGLFSFF